jgi:hypothetical protein
MSHMRHKMWSGRVRGFGVDRCVAGAVGAAGCVRVFQLRHLLEDRGALALSRIWDLGLGD